MAEKYDGIDPNQIVGEEEKPEINQSGLDELFQGV